MSLPTPTPLTPETRYFVAGTRKYSWVPTIATKTAPSLAELSAGTDLTAAVVAGAIAGFALTTALLDVPDAGSDITSQIRARTTFGNNSIDFYISTAGPSTDVRNLLTFGLAGFVVIYTEGIVSGGKCDVWPVSVLRPMLSEDTEKAGQVTIPFAVTSLPALAVTIPTS